MRDWGYGDWGHGNKGFIEQSPESFAAYSKRDSRALSKVSDDDLVDELQVRLLENGTLPAVDLYDKIMVSIDKYRLHLKEY
jgi:hypothetical protein